MEKIRRLRQKKGFTMIELIVVIAIIGVLIALVLPAMNTGDKATAGKGYAKDYYYKVQSFMSRKKLAGDKSIDSDTIIYVDFQTISTEITDDDCGIAEVGVANRTPCSSLSDGSPMQVLLHSFARDMDKTLSSPSFNGTLYAVVDKEYRVQAAYWTDGNWSQITSGLEFTDDCVISSGYYSCAYPARLCAPEGSSKKEMFKYS